MSYEQYLTEDVRLVILTELARSPNGHLNDDEIARLLDLYVRRRSREWVRSQLNKLEELGAVALIPAGSLVVAAISQAGRDHVERRALLDGVARPSLGP